MELRGKRVWLASQDATGQMGRRVKLGESALQAAKETQATGVLTVTLEMSVKVVLPDLMETREILGALEDLVRLAQTEMVDQRERGEVLDHLVFLERKETLEPLESRVFEARRVEEETMVQRVHKGLKALRERRVKVGLRARGDFPVKQEAMGQRVMLACQDLGDQQAHQERKEEPAAEVTLVMLDLEESLETSDQRETMEELALAIRDQEENRVTEETRVSVDLVAPEVTVVKRVNLDLKELQDNQASQGPRVNLDQEAQKEKLGVMEILALRGIPASLNVTS